MYSMRDLWFDRRPSPDFSRGLPLSRSSRSFLWCHLLPRQMPYAWAVYHVCRTPAQDSLALSLELYLNEERVLIRQVQIPQALELNAWRHLVIGTVDVPSDGYVSHGQGWAKRGDGAARAKERGEEGCVSCQVPMRRARALLTSARCGAWPATYPLAGHVVQGIAGPLPSINSLGGHVVVPILPDEY